MLRQANDQLERTMTEKQNLEDSVKVGNEETAAKVCTQWMYMVFTGKGRGYKNLIGLQKNNYFPKSQDDILKYLVMSTTQR